MSASAAATAAAAAATTSDSSGKEEEAAINKRYCIGIDPGSVNMGVAVYDLETKRCTQLKRVELRPPGTGGNDIGGGKLAQQTTNWLMSEYELFSNSFVFIEEQPPEAVREIVRVQDFIQQGCTMMGVPCRAVNAAAYKSRFDSHFPRHPKYFEFPVHRRKANQKKYDRTSACANAKTVIDSEIWNKYEYETKDAAKNDDAYEAFYIAWYGAIALVKEDKTSLRATPLPAPAVKPSDEPRKRGRVQKTKARAKWEARQKASAKTSSSRSRPQTKKPTPKSTSASAAAAAAAASVSKSNPDTDTVDLTGLSEPSISPTHKRKRDDADDTEEKRSRTE